MKAENYVLEKLNGLKPTYTYNYVLPVSRPSTLQAPYDVSFLSLMPP